MNNRIKRILSENEIEILAQATSEKSRWGLRDSTLILLMYRCGLRPRELAELRWSDIDLSTGIMRIGRVKSGANTQHYLDREYVVRLKHLFEARSKDMAHDATVFVTERQSPFSVRAIHLAIARAGKLAGFPFSVNPSMLRQTCGFELAKTGTAKQVQAVLGYKRLRNAAQYARRVTETAVLPDTIARTRRGASAGNEIKSGVESSLTLLIPASTANLGPGLDTIGLAVTAYTRLTFTILETDDRSVPPIQLIGGIQTASNAKDQGDLIYTILKKLWKKNKNLLQRLRLTVRSDVPLGCGLGSSGTAILGALWASQVLIGEIPTRSALLAHAQDIEGHPETLAASLVGQMVVAAPTADKVLIEQLAWPTDWHLLFIIPPYTLTTPVAKSVLPKSVLLGDAIFNIQRTALIIAAVSRADEAIMKEALVDKLHESYRAKLVPELAQIRGELKDQPIIGCVLSGAGSSVLVIVHKRHKPTVVERLNAWIAQQQPGFRLLPLEVDTIGMQELKFD
jgi:homoserine kinase